MHFRHLLWMASSVALLGCNAGFDIDETDPDSEGNSDPTFFGPSLNGSWTLTLDDEGNDFSLEKKTTPTGSQVHFLIGTYDREDNNGFTELTISSNRDSTIKSEKIIVLEVGDNLVVMEPIETNSSFLIYAIPENDCPEKNLSGNWLLLNSELNASEDTNAFYGDYRYRLEEDAEDLEVTINSGYSLEEVESEDDQENLQPPDIASSECVSGVAETTNGDHYLSNNDFGVIENKDANDDYQQLLLLPDSSIANLEDIEGDYTGFLQTFDLNDVSYISANCNDSQCAISVLTDYSNNNSGTLSYTFNFTDAELNEPERGYLKGTLTSETLGSEETKLSCSATTELNIEGSSTDQKLLLCLGQDPNDTSKQISFVLLDKS